MDPDPDPTLDPTLFFNDFNLSTGTAHHLSTNLIFLLKCCVKILFCRALFQYLSPLNIFMGKVKNLEPDPDPDPYP